MEGLFAAALLLGASAFGAGFFGGALLGLASGPRAGERHSQRRAGVLHLTDEMRVERTGAVKPGDELAETDLDLVHGGDDAAEAGPASPGNGFYVSRPHKWRLA